jgi:putative toxin-antitoxin system antitoxin component (TIGR02293 family)
VSFAFHTIAEALGLRQSAGAALSPFKLMSAIESGLSIRSLEHVSNLVAPSDASFKYRIVPKASLARRRNQKDQKLSAEQGEKIARLAEVWAMARDIWADAEDARIVLSRPHPLLDGNRPIDLVLKSELGARMVRDVLDRGRYGSAA